SSLNIQPSPGLDFTEEYYLFAGHRIEPNSISTDNLPVGYSERFGRVWAVEKTGAVDISILSFSFTALTDIEGTPDPNGTYALLYAQTVSPLSFAPLNTIATEVTDTGINFSLTNEQLQNGYYTLGAVDKIFNDPSSNTEPTSVKPANIYPNPATTTIAIPDIKARANYTITSINGQRSVSGQFTPGQRIDINLLPTGAYLIHLVTEDGEAISARFIKQ
ncbi:MAG: T9SS type A sorting domain-containing protein, partial [Cyanobacteria bacterium J06649_11]